MKIKISELKLGDRVRTGLPYEAFRDSVVEQIKDGNIKFFRPYVHTADFSYTGGVICYTGIEEFHIPANDSEVEVFERKDLR